jgi:hypothetical protein
MDLNIYQIIQNSTLVLWLLLAIRQAKGKWGWFFLIFGLTDTLGVFLWWLGILIPSQLSLGHYFLVLFALYYNFFDKYKLYLFPIGILIVIPTLCLEYNTINTIAFFVNIIIFIFFFTQFITSLFKNNKLNLFFLSLSLYFMLSTTKYFVLATKVWSGVDSHMLTTIFQNFLMFGFLFIRHDDERLSIDINKKIHN